MIKKLMVLAGVTLVALSSCKKKYACECNTILTAKNSSGTFSSDALTNDKIYFSSKMTEKQAISACKHAEATVQSSITNLFTDNGNYVMKPGESISTACTVEL